jgi:hypothetical protein
LPLPLGVLRRGEALALHQLLGVPLGALDASFQLPLRVAVDLLDARTAALGHFQGVVRKLLRLLRGLHRLLLGLTRSLGSVLGALHPELERILSKRHRIAGGLAESATLVPGLRGRTLRSRAHRQTRCAHSRNGPLRVGGHFRKTPSGPFQ